MTRTIQDVRTAVEDGFAAALARSAGTSFAVTYARKLRRQILGALESTESDVDEIVAELCSEASFMFCHAQSRVEQTHALLGDDQHRAIVTFLEFVADNDYPLVDRYRAAIGLRWLWTRFGVDRARIAAVIEPLAQYRRPIIPDRATELLARQIETAFASVPEPIQITEAGSDHARDVALLFHGQRWESLHPAIIDLEPAAPSVFTHDAFRYYLPSYLLCVVGDVPIEADPLPHLIAPSEERFEGFSSPECGAIAATLKARIAHVSAARQDAIVRALDYWTRRA